MRCPNCGAETWGQGGVCEYCGASLTGQAGRASGNNGGRPEERQGSWRQVPAPAPPTGGRASRQDAPQGQPQGSERRPSTLGDLFGPSNAQPAERGGGEPPLPRFGPAKGPPTPRRGAPMASASAPPADGRWRVSPDLGERPPFSRPPAPDADEAPPPDRRGFAEPDNPHDSKARERTRWSAGPLQQFRRQVRDQQEQEDEPRPRVPSKRKPVDTAKRLGRRLALSLGVSDDAQQPPRAPTRHRSRERQPQDARRSPPTPRSSDFGQAWQAPPPGAGWDFGPGQQGPNHGAKLPASPHPLGGEWPGAATELPWQQDDIPSELDSDYHDTGRGWSIAMPALQEDQPGFARPMTAGPRKTAGVALGDVGVLVLRRLGRYTFNLILLAVILAILAIPVSMGLARLGTLRQAINPAVAASKTPRPMPTAYAGYQSYATGLFSISYPTAWSRGTASHDVNPGGTEQETTFTSPDKSMLLTVGTLTAVPADQSQFTLQALARAFLSGMTANYTTISAPGTGATLDGQPGIKVDFTCDYLEAGQHLVNLQATAILRTQGLTTYVVIYAAPSSQFSSAQGQYFNAMLASLLLNA